jgi:hypothetical protein
MWWIWLVIVGVLVAVGLVVLWIVCAGRGSSSTSQRPRAEVTEETAIQPQFIAAKDVRANAAMPQSEMDDMTRLNPVFSEDVSGSEIYLEDCESRDGGEVAGQLPRFQDLEDVVTSGEGGECEVWGTVTLTKRLQTFAGQERGEGDGLAEDGDDDELKYEEEGGERDDRGEPEGPDGIEDDDLYDEQEQGQDDEYAYNDDQQGGAEVADFPPWDGGEFPFDPRVDDRYFQHSSDDEAGSDPPLSDEFDPDGEDEPLRF